MPEIPSAPIWLRLAIGILPVPVWLKNLIPIVYALIKSLPKDSWERLRSKLRTAAHNVKDGEPHTEVTKVLLETTEHLHRRCEGIGCPSDIVSGS